MIIALMWKMVSLIEDIDTFFRLRKDYATPQRQIRQHQIVITHDTVCLIHGITGLIETAISEVAALGPHTLGVIYGNRPPIIITDRAFPVIPIAFPVAHAELI